MLPIGPISRCTNAKTRVPASAPVPASLTILRCKLLPRRLRIFCQKRLHPRHEFILSRFGVESSVRPSLALYNTCADVDALIAVLRRLTSARSRF